MSPHFLSLPTCPSAQHSTNSYCCPRVPGLGSRPLSAWVPCRAGRHSCTPRTSDCLGGVPCTCSHTPPPPLPPSSPGFSQGYRSWEGREGLPLGLSRVPFSGGVSVVSLSPPFLWQPCGGRLPWPVGCWQALPLLGSLEEGGELRLSELLGTAVPSPRPAGLWCQVLRSRCRAFGTCAACPGCIRRGLSRAVAGRVRSPRAVPGSSRSAPCAPKDRLAIRSLPDALLLAGCQRSASAS